MQAFSTVFSRYTNVMSLFAQFYLPSEQLVIYNLVKFFVPLLSSFTTHHCSIKDSFSYATEISLFPDSNCYFMATFDIKSLFKNIPLEETVFIVTENYFNITRLSRNSTP